VTSVFLGSDVVQGWKSKDGDRMKGIILACMNEMIEKEYDKESWKKIVSDAGLGRKFNFLVTEDIDDERVMAIVESTSKITGKSVQDVFDAFGEYWANTFAPRIYSTYFRNSETAKDFILRLDSIHKDSTDRLPNSHPPRFEYEWKDDKKLLLHYKSNRKLVDLAISLLRGIGGYFGEDLKIDKMDDTTVKIVFEE